MTSWNGYDDFVRRVALSTEVPLVSLKRPDGHQRGNWGISAPGVPATLMIRETEEGLDVAVDWITLSARALSEIDDPAAYVVGTAGMGLLVGAMAGRSARTALVGGLVGGLLGLLSQNRGSVDRE